MIGATYYTFPPRSRSLHDALPRVEDRFSAVCRSHRSKKPAFICSDRSEDAGRAACHRRRSRDHMSVRACVPKSYARLATPRATTTRRPRRRRQLAHGARRFVGFQWWRQGTTQRLNRGCQRNPPRQTTGAAGATTTGAAGATTTGAAGRLRPGLHWGGIFRREFGESPGHNRLPH